jgi:hypothetical protein
MTRLPIRSPIATAISSTAAPAISRIVGKRVEVCTLCC